MSDDNERKVDPIQEMRTDIRVSDSYRAKEINWLLQNAESYGYVRIGNSWILP